MQKYAVVTKSSVAPFAKKFHELVSVLSRAFCASRKFPDPWESCIIHEAQSPELIR